ncbi:hypothetical protein DPMN_054050 [Dreissena polymorpha]|uniref:Uncharacterized protein n=1 Tax=Dreissena polymorpha TaxID=45954 RepID=A0A9D4CMH9_DREPO|nr:hypothetical protein DPMN_054050 [Dreissena polymorpha]
MEYKVKQAVHRHCEKAEQCNIAESNLHYSRLLDLSLPAYGSIINGDQRINRGLSGRASPVLEKRYHEVHTETDPRLPTGRP